MKRDTYKVQVKRNGRVVMKHATSNPKLFGQDIKARWPDAVVETVGVKTTREAANRWCNEKSVRRSTMQKRTPVKSTKKGPKEERDVMGFRKKDYPIIGFVALLVLNVWAFNANTTSTIGVMIAIGIDLLVAFWLYKKYWPKKAEAKTIKSKGSTTAKARRTAKEDTKGNELGLFGIKKKHYPTLAIALAGIITLSAIMNRTTLLIIGAIIVDLGVGYWYYKRRGKK